MTAASSTSTTSTASVRVELQARGASGLDDDAQNASYAVAQWLEARHDGRLAHFSAYAAMMETGDETPEGQAFQALLDDAAGIADTAATAGWADPAGCDVTVTITPR